ncbi:WapI family immunity protein [Tellurirhabdus rosea]|uniref:WapI family immunity protein n=1 Tax=Tellurirhabdus rosea TaxID=2674997 RepID=UPI00224FB252|nr:hypothetical protein [Tellurirhabdus rosea]
MILTGPRSTFELNILDYEYQHSASNLDRNWLLMGLRTRWQGHEATLTAPLLLTWELELLVKWLNFIATTSQPLPRLQFTEPCLSFECLSVSATDFLLQIKLDCEASPYWHTDLSSAFWLPVIPSRLELVEATEQLREELCAFPERA